jgi:hypothetical protein
MFETARTIIQSSLPTSFAVEQRRLAVAQRLYGSELPEAALIDHSMFKAVEAQAV